MEVTDFKARTFGCWVQTDPVNHLALFSLSPHRAKAWLLHRETTLKSLDSVEDLAAVHFIERDLCVVHEELKAADPIKQCALLTFIRRVQRTHSAVDGSWFEILDPPCPVRRGLYRAESYRVYTPENMHWEYDVAGNLDERLRTPDALSILQVLTAPPVINRAG